MQPNKDQNTTNVTHGEEGTNATTVPPFSSTGDPLSLRFAGATTTEDTNNLTTASTGDSTNHQMEEALRRRTTPFVSRHRKALNHIDSDSRLARRHPVPSSRPSAGGAAGGGGGGGGVESSAESIQNLCGKWTSSFREAYAKKSVGDWIGTLLPVYSWLKGYPWRTAALQDLVAGLTVGVMIVPQSMSYAKLAGLPVEYGLYSSFIPVFTYSLFGSSRQLAVGPVAIISLLLSTGVTQVLKAENINVEDPRYNTRYMQLAVQISFLVGVTNILMGLMRMGFVTNFLSHAVISGFTSGASVIIGMSQLKYIFGYEVKRSDRFHEVLQYIFENISQFNWKTFVMGTVSIAILMLMKHVGKTVPKLKKIRAMGPLSVTVLGIILSVALDFGGGSAIPLVGDIPKGLPSFTAGEWLPLESMDKLILITISIAIVGFMESIAIAKTLASKHKYEIDSSMELIGLGMANFMGGMFQAYPVTGSFSRSAVNHESGAQSGISAIITASLVGLVLLFLTPVFEKLPLNTLAAIVISGVMGLFDYPEAIYLWRVHKFDFCVWMTAFLGTLFLGVEIGLAIAVCVSLLIVIYESAYPHTSVLGRLPGTSIYRNVKQYPEAERYDGIVMVRIDAPVYFANAQNVRDKIRKYRLLAQEELDARNGTVKYLILELSPVSHVDTSALHILDDMYETYLARGQQMLFANPCMKVMHRFIDSGFAEQVGGEHFFVSLSDAVNWCLQEMDTEALSILESSAQNSDLSTADVDEENPVVNSD